MGSETYQIHSFDCCGCTLPITIGLRKVGAGGRIECEENGRILDGEIKDATVMNLHASFSFDETIIHDRYSFPSILFFQKIHPFVRVLSKSKVQDIALLFEVPNCQQLWGLVRNAMTLVKQGTNDRQLERLFEGYRHQREKCVGRTVISNTEDLIHNFFDAMFYPRFEVLVKPVRAHIAQLRASSLTELERFIQYYRANHWEESYARNTSLFTDYFRAFTEFSQMLTYARIDDQDVSTVSVQPSHID